MKWKLNFAFTSSWFVGYFQHDLCYGKFQPYCKPKINAEPTPKGTICFSPYLDANANSVAHVLWITRRSLVSVRAVRRGVTTQSRSKGYPHPSESHVALEPSHHCGYHGLAPSIAVIMGEDYQQHMVMHAFSQMIKYHVLGLSHHADEVTVATKMAQPVLFY